MRGRAVWPPWIDTCRDSRWWDMKPASRWQKHVREISGLSGGCGSGWRARRSADAGAVSGELCGSRRTGMGLAGVLQARGDSGDTVVDDGAEDVGAGFIALAADVADGANLDEAHGIDVRIAQADGTLQPWPTVQQTILSGDGINAADGTVEFGAQQVEVPISDRLVSYQSGVPLGYGQVGFAQGDLRCVEQPPEEDPLPIQDRKSVV